MDFEDRRIGSEERFSGLSEGQRYALALVLNLAFVGVVIAGFAFLYTGGFGGDRASAPSAPPAATEPEDDRSEGVRFAASGGSSVALDLPEEAPIIAQPSEQVETAELEPAALARAEGRPAAPTATDGVGGPDLTAAEDELVDAADPGADVAEEDEPETLTLAALEASPPDVLEPGAATADAAALDAAAENGTAEGEAAEVAEDGEAAPPTTVAALGPSPRLAPRTAANDAAPTREIDPVASLWSTAGSLAATLQQDFPCSQFSLQADADGRPTLRARVGFSDDIDLVRARIADDFDDSSDIEGGLGCTTVIGGGYVALSDDNGQVELFGRDGLSREVRAVLPGDGACALIGQVVATQPALRQTLSSAGREATWVRSGGEPALCEENDDGMWQVVSGRNAGDRRAAALVVGDDVLATEALRSANVQPAASTSAAPAATTIASNAAPATAAPSRSSPAPTSTDGLTEVAPIEGPTPRVPDGVPLSADGYAVAVAFTVDAEGRAQDMSVVGAGMAPVPVVAAALDTVGASRFRATGQTYRASYTVRFPSAEFADLLTRLSLASSSDRSAQPIWDRTPSQTEYDRTYPDRAMRREVNGEVSVDCQIAFDGRLSCAVSEEQPRGWGFGAAALSLAEIMRAAPRMSDGGPSANETVRLEFVFNSSGAQ